MMHARIFKGDIGRLYQLSVRRPKKLFKTNPCLLYWRYAIPLANCQTELACPVKYDIGDIDRLEMCILCPRAVVEIKEFLD